MATQTVCLHIKGMTCQACANRIEKVLRKKDFVCGATVSYAGEQAQIRFDDTRTDIAGLQEIIRQTGFQAILPDEAAATGEHAPRPWRLYALLLLALPFVPGMLAMPFGIHGAMPPLWLQVLCAATAQFALATPFYRRAWAALRHGSANMDVLVSIGTLATFALSSFNLWAGRADQVYFEAGVMILAAVSLGKYWEARTKRQSLNGLALLLELTPAYGEVWRKHQWQPCPIAQIQAGDVLRTTNGGRIAADGIVLEGEAWADESHLTGESQAQHKRAGSTVIAGSLISGSLSYRAERLGRDSLLGDMMTALAEAQNSKAPIARLADRIAARFVPAVLLIALAAFVGNLLLGHAISEALLRAAAVLVVACPCALGLATPAAVMAGMGVAARHGIRFKNAAALEHSGSIDTVALDKTGTLTTGKPGITAIHCFAGWNESALLRAAAAVEQHTQQPFAAAIVRAAQAQQLALPHASQLHHETGAGIRAEVAGIGTVCVGKPEFCGFSLPDTLPADIWQYAGIAAVSVNGQPAGIFALADAPKADSAAAIQQLQQHGIALYMLSGDRHATALHIARQLSIAHAQGGLSPRDKAQAVQQLGAHGKRVAMVGDGINDAPALAAAHIGIAVHNSTAAAAHTADIQILQPSVRHIADALLIARATLRHIRQNLLFAFGYNLIGIPLAACGLLNPMLAGIFMALSSLSVLANALRLKRYRPRR